MTAINAFYDQDDRFVYLASDGAAFSYVDGTITTLGSKISIFPKYKIAFAMAGPNISAELVADVCRQLPVTQAEVLQYLEASAVIARHGMAKGKPEGEKTGVNDIAIVAAVCLETEKRPALFRLDTRPEKLTGFAPNRWHEIEGVFIPSIVPNYIAERGMYVLDAVTDTRALFRAQRHHDFEGMHGAPAVGGTCQIYRVGSDGIKAWDILQFADKPGEIANISDTGADLLRPFKIGI
jgi:hypothetical protein